MARPKKQVTTDNDAFLRAYLNRALSNPARDGMIKAGSRLVALSELNMTVKSPVAATQKWVETWLTEEAKSRMWATLRQHRYKVRHAVRMVALTDNAYTMLTNYAKRHKVTFSQAIEHLVEEEKTKKDKE